MKFVHVAEAPLAAKGDLLAFIVFGDPHKDALFAAINKALGGALAEAATAESFTGANLTTLVVPTLGRLSVKRIVVLGAGTGKREATPLQLRDLAALAHQCAEKLKAHTLAFVLPAGAPTTTAQLVVEGVLGGAYRFNKYLTTEEGKKNSPVTSVHLLAHGKSEKVAAGVARGLNTGIARGVAIGHAVNAARNWINEPAAFMTPTEMANNARAVAKKHKSVTASVLDRAACEKLKMGMFLAVAKGAAEEPKFIHMVYTPAKKAKKRVALIGKGLMFDSGGYSLKPSDSMFDMKVDMSGSAAVIAAMDAIATLGCEHEVHVIAACCENMVSGGAYKLGDILIGMDGTSVEINNTDAEGRLTLGDAITYTREKVKPDEMFDFATLTGACMVALGPYTAGVLSDHGKLASSWLAAAAATGEDMWRLPLNSRLKEQLRSPIADMRNTGERWGGTITAGLFLKHFAKDTPWVHVDIAGPASITTGRPAQPRGGTGFAVATIVQYLC